MSLITFWEKAMKRLDWKDVGLIKLVMFALALMIAKLWSGILALQWYWYGIIFVLAVIRPLYIEPILRNKLV